MPAMSRSPELPFSRSSSIQVAVETIAGVAEDEEEVVEVGLFGAVGVPVVVVVEVVVAVIHNSPKTWRIHNRNVAHSSRSPRITVNAYRPS